MSIIRPQTCRGCKFGEIVQGEPDIECRRFPPGVTAVLVPIGAGRASMQMHSGFPRLPPDSNCGEWVPKIATSEVGIPTSLTVNPAALLRAA